ncbi:hypothetical protein D3C85_1469590 [compost metagenome]
MIAGAFSQRHRRGAIQVDREPESWIDQPRNITLLGFTGEQRRAPQFGLRHDDIELPGAAPDVQGSGKGKHDSLDVEFGILERDRGVGRHVAMEIAIAYEQEIDTDRRIGVGPGFEILCACTGRYDDERSGCEPNQPDDTEFGFHPHSLASMRTPEFYQL